jgi:hypothetical protein
LLALIGLIGTAIKNPQPHGIQVGLVGPAPAVQQVSAAFDSKTPERFGSRRMTPWTRPGPRSTRAQSMACSY